MEIHTVATANAVLSHDHGPAAQLRELRAKELIARVTFACREERRFAAEVVACLVEVDRRRLHLRAAFSSLFDYCTRHLGMSGSAAHRRINAVRLVQRFPCLLPKLASGELHLCGLLILRDHLTEANAEELGAAASHLSEAQLRLLLAERSPRPPVPERLAPTVEQSSLPINGAPQPPARQSRTEPLSSTTYALQLTMSADTHAKLRRAQDMMRHRQPDGNLAVVLDRALDALLGQLERERLCTAKRPRASKGDTKRVSRATRREVFARDGQQCTYRSEAGDRCPARAFIELDHVDAEGLGGSHAASNVRVLCRAHNRLHAEDYYGEEVVASCIEQRRAGSIATPRDLAVAGGPGTGPEEDAMPEAAKADESAARQKMAVHGLTDLGFARADCIAVARAVLDRGGPDRSMVEVFREAIGELASLPRKTVRARPARSVSARPPA